MGQGYEKAKASADLVPVRESLRLRMRFEL